MAATPEPVSVRLLTPDDAPAYRALRLRGLREHPTAFTSGADEEQARTLDFSVQRLTEKPERPHDFFIGAFAAGGELLGTVGVSGRYRPKERHYATVVGMVVAPEGSGRGIGGALMRDLLTRCRQLPTLERLDLTVTAGNAPAIALYQRCGFVAWGTLPGAIKVAGMDYDKVHMALDLRPSPVN